MSEKAPGWATVLVWVAMIVASWAAVLLAWWWAS